MVAMGLLDRTPTFVDRRDAGCRLAVEVARLGLTEPVILGLPRGGVPVAAEVARALSAPLDVIVARKIGAPRHEEFGIGAVAEGNVVIADKNALTALAITLDRFEQLAAAQQTVLEARVLLYRNGRPLIDLRDRDVVVVDDGLATGVTAEAALVSLRRHPLRRLVLAVPTSASDTATRLRRLAEVVSVISPSNFTAVGIWYRDFGQTTDSEVRRLLRTAAGPAEDVSEPSA
jgi:putative phosphoribosyl transferase